MYRFRHSPLFDSKRTQWTTITSLIFHIFRTRNSSAQIKKKENEKRKISCPNMIRFFEVCVCVCVSMHRYAVPILTLVMTNRNYIFSRFVSNSHAHDPIVTTSSSIRYFTHLLPLLKHTKITHTKYQTIDESINFFRLCTCRLCRKQTNNVLALQRYLILFLYYFFFFYESPIGLTLPSLVVLSVQVELRHLPIVLYA